MDLPQIVNGDGIPQSDETKIDPTYQAQPSTEVTVARLQDKGIVLCWYQGYSSTLTDIYCMVYNPDMTVRKSSFMVNTYTANDQQEHKVIALRGRFLVLWTDFNGYD